MSRIESPDNRVLQEDLERAAALDLPIEALDGKSVKGISLFRGRGAFGDCAWRYFRADLL